MTEAADQQPGDPAYCAYETERHGVTYRCTSEVHKGGGHRLQKLDDIRPPLQKYLADTMVSDLEDRDDTAELVPADPPSATDATVAKVVHTLAGLAERKHFADAYAYEIDAGIGLAEDIAAAAAFWADYRLADVASLRRIKVRVDALLLQRGIREDGGS